MPWGWTKLFLLMTGNVRCHRRKTMNVWGADGGCVTEEKPFPVARVQSPAPETSPTAKAPANKVPECSSQQEPHFAGVDLYSQALKALSERSPFETEEAKVSTVPTLPIAFASLLSKHSDSRKRHKKSHGDTKSKRKGSAERPKGSNIWAESEENFRELSLSDIEMLKHLSSSIDLLSSNPCFIIPVLGNAPTNTEVGNVNVNSVLDNVAEVEPTVDELCSDNLNVGLREDFISGNVQSMEIDNEGSEGIPLGDQRSSLPHPLQTFSSVEWVLGSRNKILLTTERPSKKRKLLGANAGLERLIVTQPCEGNQALCHFCSAGDTGDQLNQLVVCSSCNVTVHQKCYGVQGNVDKSWMCSWCKRNSDSKAGKMSVADQPCLLCPKPGGALKRVQKAGAGISGSMDFAHLFCSQWMPEVYVDDTRLMEPIVNVEEIKETRRKLVCNLCKVRHGTCVRCTDGACRTSFHPICAREAGNRLEIWGKFGCDDVELRAFCSKHSEALNSGCCAVQGVPSDSLGSDSPASSGLQPAPVSKPPIGWKDELEAAVQLEAANVNLENLDVAQSSSDVGLHGCVSNRKRNLHCRDASEAVGIEPHKMNVNEDASTSDSIDISQVLKKFIDRGKVTLDEVASDIGTSRDLLAAALTGDQLALDLLPKLREWLKGHAYSGNFERKLYVKFRPALWSIGTGGDDGSHAVSVKSVPPMRRTINNPRIVKDDSVSSPGQDKLRENGVSDVKDKQLKAHSGLEKILVARDEFQDLVADPSPHSETGKPNEHCKHECRGREYYIIRSKGFHGINQDISVCPSVIKMGSAPGFHVHSFIKEEIKELQGRVLKNQVTVIDGQREPYLDMQRLWVAGGYDNHPDPYAAAAAGTANMDHGVILSGFGETKKIRDLDMIPDDEVEGEMIYMQCRLIRNAVAKKFLSDDLIGKIVKNLPQEIDYSRRQMWDTVHVNQYLYELREARKQGRKERRHKEAQALLEAANAVAAASCRASSFRKDSVDELPHQQNHLKLEVLRGRGGLSSQPIPRVKETTSSFALRVMSENNYANAKENPRSCDVCRRSETLLNPILVCSSCKVAVHLDCYRSVKGITGPWCCELCEEQLGKCSRALTPSSWEKQCPVPECGLCGAPDGAFRKSSNGQWLHAFCAEWVFESTFRRGQIDPVEGMETILKGNDTCSVCHRRYGVCIKCNYGHCQSTFHPSCARCAGYYMNVKNVGGKLQHKAYCEKHSVEQKAKAETQKHGVEELKSLSQVRVELERLRLLCERIVKREKLKRELVICSYDILDLKRDSAVVRARSPSFPPEVSSESATTSLRGDGSRSYSEAMQKSDDATVDSLFSSRHRIRFPISVDIDQKTDDSSPSQKLPTPQVTDRVSFGGKQIPLRALAGCNVPDSGGKRLPTRKHAETFEKELVMTSDQATMKNQRLPKGYIYVPINCLSNEKQTSPDSIGQGEQDD